MLPNSFLSLNLSGLDAALPSTTAFAGVVPAGAVAYYYATDTNILYRWTGSAWDATMPKPVAVGAAATARAIAGVTYLLNTAAGSVLTLPGATGSGLQIEVVTTVTTTSGAHKVLTSPITDKLIGNVSGQNANAAKPFSAATAADYHSLQMPFAGTQPSGGFEGDWFNFTDIAAGVWLIQGMYQAGTIPTTPFSTATS